MKKKLYKSLALMLVWLLTLGTLGILPGNIVQAQAANEEEAEIEATTETASGTLGTNGALWRLFDDGIVTVNAGNIPEGFTTNPWYDYQTYIHKITFSGPIVVGTSMSALFAGLPYVTHIEGLSYFDTSEVRDMCYVFDGAESITELDLSEWDINNVETMHNMLYGTKSLQQITFGNHFRFVNNPGLPMITPTDSFTGYWVNVGTGTLENPQSEHVLTSNALVAFYTNPIEPHPSDTWVWQRVAYIPTPSFTVTLINDPAGTPIVSGQYGAGSYEAGGTVILVAGTRPGYAFVNWLVNLGNVVLSDPYSPTTDFIMPDHAVILTAQWEPTAVVGDLSGDFTCESFLNAVRSLPGVPNTGPIFAHQLSNPEFFRLPYFNNLGITSIDGIQHITALQRINLSGNFLTELDFSGNPGMVFIDASNNDLFSVNVSANPLLEVLFVQNNHLTHVHLGNNPRLEWLNVADNQLTSLQLASNTALVNLRAYDNMLTSLNINNHPALLQVRAQRNQLSSLTISASPLLNWLDAGNNQLSSLNIAGSPRLTTLHLNNNLLSGLDVSRINASTLTWLNVQFNNMATYDAVTGWQSFFPVVDPTSNARPAFFYAPQNHEAVAVNVLTVHGSQYPAGVGAGRSGAGQHAHGTLVTIRAGERPGYNFNGWTVNVGGISLSNPANATTTFNMLDEPATVTATWIHEDAPPPTHHFVWVHDSQLPDGSGSGQSGAGEHAVGATVTIRAGTKADHTFGGWMLDSGGVSLANETAATTTFIMPAHDVGVTALWHWNAPEEETPEADDPDEPNVDNEEPDWGLDSEAPAESPDWDDDWLNWEDFGDGYTLLSRLENVDCPYSAAEAVQGMLEQVLSGGTFFPDGFIEAFAEAAITQAVTTPFNQALTLTVNRIAALEDTARYTRDMIIETMQSMGYTPNRPLLLSVSFLTPESDNLHLQVERSAAFSSVERIWVKTPFYAVVLTRDFIEENTNSPLNITLTSEVSNVRPFIPRHPILPDTPGAVITSAPTPRSSPSPQPSPSPTPQPLPEPDTEPPSWIFGTPWAVAVLGATTEQSGHRTVTIHFDRPVTSPLRLVMPASPAENSTEQVVRCTMGTAVPARVNPTTGNIEARINQSGTFVAVTNQLDFSDIHTQTPEIQNAIRHLTSQGMMQGVTLDAFHPDAPVTRAQAAALMVRMLGLHNPNATHNFNDVQPTDWFNTIVGTAAQQGLMSGTTTHTFSPDQYMTREQLVGLAARILRNEMGYIDPFNPGDYLFIFSDSGSIANWAQPGIALAVRENLLLQRSGAFGPRESITRGEAALIFYHISLRLL